jgi:hypothetical protein
LHFEGVVERLLFGVLRLKAGDAENVSEVVHSLWRRRSVPFEIGFESECEHIGDFWWTKRLEVKVLDITYQSEAMTSRLSLCKSTCESGQFAACEVRDHNLQTTIPFTSFHMRLRDQ